MRRHHAVIMAFCILAAIATASSGSYVSELLFAGEGWYDHDAGPKLMTAYGDFGASTIDFDMSIRTPDEACNWYLKTDLALTFVGREPRGAITHQIRMDDAGIWADQQLIAWTDLGYAWDAQHGVHLGYHDPNAMRWEDPFNLIGDYSWDLDGGGTDLTASILPSPTPDYSYRVATEQKRSMTWLSTMPLGSMAAGWASAFLGGLPLDGLELGINKVAPLLGLWDKQSYDIVYRGSVLLIADTECPVPEPSTILLLGTGLMAVGSFGLRRRRRGE